MRATIISVLSLCVCRRVLYVDLHQWKKLLIKCDGGKVLIKSKVLQRLLKIKHGNVFRFIGIMVLWLIWSGELRGMLVRFSVCINHHCAWVVCTWGCVSAWERERERVCVCVCVRERERESLCVCPHMSVLMCMCVYICYACMRVCVCVRVTKPAFTSQVWLSNRDGREHFQISHTPGQTLYHKASSMEKQEAIYSVLGNTHKNFHRWTECTSHTQKKHCFYLISYIQRSPTCTQAHPCKLWKPECLGFPSKYTNVTIQFYQNQYTPTNKSCSVWHTSNKYKESVSLAY